LDFYFRLLEHESWVLDVAFSNDGKYMTSSSWKGDVIVWDMTSLNPMTQLNGHSEGKVGINQMWCKTEENLFTTF
jgi:WD domain, G-beta repeat.